MGTIADAATSFGLTVVSETGDKSQLLLIALAARWQRLPVAIGGVAGIAGVQLVAVLVGGWLGSTASDRTASIIALVVGIAFVTFGLAALASARTSETGEHSDGSVDHRTPRNWSTTVAATTGLLFAAELGDKTMFTTAALSAVRSPFAVFVGATAAFAALTTIAVLIGGAFAKRVPDRALKLVAGVAFLITGLVTIATI